MKNVRKKVFKFIVSKISQIWKASQDVRKENKRFKRIQEKKFHSFSQDMTKLNQLAKQSLSKARKEYEKIKYEQEKIRLNV